MFNKVTILSHIHACMVLVWHIFAGRVLSYGTIFLLPDIFLSKKYVFATDFNIFLSWYCIYINLYKFISGTAEILEETKVWTFDFLEDD